MENKPKVTKYEGKTGDVTWDERLCIHYGECGRAATPLFVGGRDPWCQPDAVPSEKALDVVSRCPTGALAFYPKGEAAAETVAKENTIDVSANGPLYVRGELEISGVPNDMPGVKFRAALCRCGQSKNKPFCDNSHAAAKFQDSGAVGTSGEATVEKGGPLRVSPAPNGPLLLSGNAAIYASSGRRAWQGTKCALCRCGASKNKPFCDGSHKAAGFVG